MEDYKGYTINLTLGPDFQGMYSAFIPGNKERTLVETHWFNVESESDKEDALKEIKEMIDTCLDFSKKLSYDEKIIAYVMNEEDERLAGIALLIIEAYNGSYKPHLFNEIAFHNSENYYDIKHTNEGYSLIFTKAEKRNPSHKRIATTDEHINDFIEHVFLILTGDTSVKWTKIVNTSAAVKNALNKHYGMEVELSNVGYDHKFDMFGIPELPIKPTIWAKRTVDDTAFKEMEDKGFTYFDRDLWEITL